MGEYFITFRSVTLAQRGELVLKKNGIRCRLQRTPRWMEEQGCGYCLRVDGQVLGGAVNKLQGSGIQFRKIYLQQKDGSVEEVTV